ncbi:MAG TPA: hypothetical protein VN937_25265 [Blastocatellia bacterium]|nr:hypothetical protein [Blastocatellia bacterium]
MFYALLDVDQGEEELLICADFVSLICADQRTDGSVNQRFRVSDEDRLNHY